MGWFRIGLLGAYAGAFLLLAHRRRDEARAAARGAGTRIERAFWCRQPGHARSFVFVLVALLLTFVGRLGFAIAVAWTLLTAPLAAASARRLLAVAADGLLLDGRFVEWSGLSGFAVDGRSGRLTWWSRTPGEKPREVLLAPTQAQAVASALRPKLAELDLR